jgi:hypothetical protein
VNGYKGGGGDFFCGSGCVYLTLHLTKEMRCIITSKILDFQVISNLKLIVITALECLGTPSKVEKVILFWPVAIEMSQKVYQIQGIVNALNLIYFLAQSLHRFTLFPAVSPST